MSKPTHGIFMGDKSAFFKILLQIINNKNKKYKNFNQFKTKLFIDLTRHTPDNWTKLLTLNFLQKMLTIFLTYTNLKKPRKQKARLEEKSFIN